MMRPWGDRSVTQKLAITTLLAIGGALLLAGVGDVAADAWLFRKYLQRDLSTLARVIAAHSTAALAFNDPAAATEALAALRERSHIRGACIYDNGPPEELFARYKSAQDFECPAKHNLASDPALSLAEPIILDDNQIGTLVLYYDLGEVRDRILVDVGSLAAVFVFAAGVAFLLSGRMRETISIPISRLVEVTTLIAKTGDYRTRARKTSGDELGLLVDRFNDMLSGIQQRESDLKQAIERIEEERARFRFMAESMPQKILTTTSDGLIDYVNSRWTEYTGLAVDDFKDHGLLKLLHPEDRASSVKGWDEAVASGNAFTIEQRLRRADGAYRWHLTTASAMRGQDGRVTMWIGSSTDIHEQKEREEELRRANDDLRQFAYSASHDLQEPIRNVAVFSELLGRQLGSSPDRESQTYLNYVLEGARRLSRMVAGLLAYTGTSSTELSSATVDANAVLSRVLTTLEGTIRENDAVVVADELPRVEMGDLHLEQVFQNLIANALKYRSDRQPRIEVRVQDRDEAWRFSVADNGIGIDPQYKEKIFGLFKRLSHRRGGTGIGLAICQRIVERYGGRIWVEGRPGEGSTFYFTIPRRSQS